MSSPNSNPRSSAGSMGRPQTGTAPRVESPARPSQRPAGAPAGSTTVTASKVARPGAGQPAGQSKLIKPAQKAKARRARLLVSRIDPWSVFKMSFLLSVALGIVTVVAAIVLWTVLDLTGIFDGVNALLNEVGGPEGGGFDLRSFASLGQVVSFSMVIGVVNVVLLTALSVLAAVLYNIASALVGGIGVTLTDD